MQLISHLETEMAEKVNLTIDVVEVQAEPGSVIIQAAMDNDLYIPYLCYYPGMKPYGACRMCVVKAEAPTPDGSYRSLPGSLPHAPLLYQKECVLRQTQMN